jgi:hypothetical protein
MRVLHIGLPIDLHLKWSECRSSSLPQTTFKSAEAQSNSGPRGMIQIVVQNARYCSKLAQRALLQTVIGSRA